jgi:peptidoglycan/LPS O-acetylase OafA/YrhL
MGKAGFIGVDVFFVISGFLITTIIVQQLRANKFNIWQFLYRRVRRLYPALLVTLVIYLAAGYVLLLPDMFRELGLEALLSQLYIINFYFWRTVNYFGLQAGTVPLLHMWSLAVEEQFYLLFPAFCLLIHKFQPKWLFPAILIITLGSFGLGLIATPWKQSAAFYLLPTRAWELSLGSTLAIVCLDRHPKGSWLKVCGPVGLAFIAASVLIYTPATLVPGWYALLPAFGAALLLLGGFDQSAPIARMLSLPPLVFIGLISYPLYLIHWPVMILIKENVLTFTLPWRLAGFGLSYLLAWLIYAAIETPIRSGRSLQATRKFMITAGATTTILIATTTLVFQQNGMPQRFSKDVSDLLAYQTDSAEAFQQCQSRLKSITQPCRLGKTDATPDILIIGDSHANAYAEAIDIWLTQIGRSGLFSFVHGCMPVLDMGGSKCNEQAQDAVKIVQSKSKIKTVMMISIWRQPFEKGILHAGRWVSGADAVDAFNQELQRTVIAFSQNNAEVILVEPFFAVGRNVPRTLAKNAAFGRDWPVTQTRAKYDATFAKLFAAFSRAQDLGAKRISLIDSFCIEGVCDGVVAGHPIFSDNNHLASWVSKRLSDILKEKVP